MMSKVQYLRDSRSPAPKSEAVSRIMSANKAKDTSPEISLRKALWAMGIRGYRKNFKSVPGRPDIAFTSKKVAIFVNGCYWHRCPTCNFPIPKTNSDFWREKFRMNKLRDKRKIKELQKLGWRTIVIWECDIKRDLKKEATLIKKMLAITP